MNYNSKRGDFVKWIGKQLKGPISEASLLNGIAPLERFPLGSIYPIVEGGQGLDIIEDDDFFENEQNNINDVDTDDSVKSLKSKRYIPPSSLGFSFFIMGNIWELSLSFSATHYKNEDKNNYKRSVLDEKFITITHNTSQYIYDIWQDEAEKYRAKVEVRSRPYQQGQIITVSLANCQEILNEKKSGKDYWIEENEKSLFEVELSCSIDKGNIGEYPRVDFSLLDEEMQELEFQYRHKTVYAVGHGCAVDWRIEKDKRLTLFADFMPKNEVPKMTAKIAGINSQYLSMKYLLKVAQKPEEICQALYSFIDQYHLWIDGKKDETTHLTVEYQAVSQRIINRMDEAYERMKEAVAFLQNNKKALLAFSWMNQVMLEQMIGETLENTQKNLDDFRWRPFQLAFILTTLLSSLDEDNDYRDTVDLIWFPTGGGKTEAYLGLIAFVILWRRLSYAQSGGGTTVFMRYTLRLLTTQQFLRASRLICALELLRQKNIDKLGKEAITIGLWVGASTSPNTFRKAKGLLATLPDASSYIEGLVLDACPWCQQVFRKENCHIASDDFYFTCHNKSCEFGYNTQRLPINVVDEALYKRPPTLLMATVDKFARLVWEERTQAFFGIDSGNKPPELIIQDELHLISSALGSIAGLYEAGIEVALNELGVYPKYIASTATIRMAKEQVKKLYAKEVAIFPPPGLEVEDSFFARSVPLDEEPGRLYVGYFAPRLSRQKSVGPLVSTLLAAPKIQFTEEDQDYELLREAWWTQIIYHGSLKGVGNTSNAFSIDIRNFLQRLEQETIEKRKNTHDENKEENTNQQEFTLLKRLQKQPSSLTSLSTAVENAQTFSRLENEYGEMDCLDVVLATNMVSVGLDVSRLALMVINGQPLTTAEYIQASSRVGRSNVPGIVFINYYRDQARSLSHFENFRSYHESFYRYVEPSSVTPFTYQARKRALHAALVIVLRNTIPTLRKNNQAGNFDMEADDVKKAIASFSRRCQNADPSRAQHIEKHIQSLIEDWQEYVFKSRESKRNLYFDTKSRSYNRLLYNHNDKHIGLWPTLQSMRNVEDTGLIIGL